MADFSRIIIVDTETTGLGVPRGGRVIEVGAVAVENGKITEEFSTLINSGAAISYGAFRVHGISEEMLAGQPSPEEVWPAFIEFIGNSHLAAHNSTFDSGFIRNELGLQGLSAHNQWHCTLRLARKQLPNLHNHKLGTVYEHLFGPIPQTIQTHRALDDARMTAKIWIELSKR